MSLTENSRPVWKRLSVTNILNTAIGGFLTWLIITCSTWIYSQFQRIPFKELWLNRIESIGISPLKLSIILVIIPVLGIMIYQKWARRRYIQGISILSATYRWNSYLDPEQLDITEKVRRLVSKGNTTMVVDPATFGISDPAPNHRKELHLHYKINGEEKVLIKVDGQRFRIDGMRHLSPFK